MIYAYYTARGGAQVTNAIRFTRNQKILRL